ncbi:tRNA (adenine(58)-N(1))-methyltransferase non-catalytic subunit trm6 [Linum perenne]
MSNSTVHPDSFPSSRVASEGSSVLLDVNDGDRLVFSRLTSGAFDLRELLQFLYRTLKIGNQNFSLKPLIGCPFGTLLQVENGAEGPFLSPVTPSEGENSVQEKGECEITDESRDNRGLVDDNKAQTLTGDDIDEMRRQGAKGDEIIEALIANSATFGKKTSFSQEKYRLKKQKKYAPRVLLRRPFTRRFLRVDTLSLLLSLANIGGNSDVLVVDMVGGLVTGAVAERLGGTGCVCNTYLGSAPYSMEIDKTSAINMEDISLSSDHEVVDARTETTAKTIKINKTPKHGEKPSHETFKLWKEQGFSSLIIAAPDLDPWSAVKRLLPLLSYSAPFAIYHQYLQPLATCMHNLQAEKMAIGLQLSEPWVREYQVLPSRTHPFMQMNASGGYVLSGTRISTAANDGLRS